ncbi:uncharacterized protein J4E92_007376 [Alternaria infectoria]|uniref:uncharacterized protein n=1 Tax=Alternaria infectoria TaxID=45303 RepID=UPI0022201174|nr:uncharacterized protein J4E92_007376 [Alternaria infectoria]KAI4924295.1 hypothetical protein J4E92_007376 [Alternaria infectoria]
MASSSDPTPLALRKRPRKTNLASSQLDGVSDELDQETNIKSWLSTVEPSVEPPSNTALCRVSYSFKILPSIHIIPIKVTSLADANVNTDSDHRPIFSKRLRKHAIESFIKKELVELENNYSLRLAETGFKNAAEEGLIDHILVLDIDMEQGTERKLREISDRKEILVPTVEKRVRNEKIAEAVYCDVQAREVFSVKTEATTKAMTDKYWKMLKLLIRDVTIRSIPPKGFLSNCKQILFDNCAEDPNSPLRPDFETDASVSSDWSSFSSLKSQDALVIKEANFMKVLFRSNVKIDPVQPALHLEFDLVPGLGDGIRLSDLVLGVLGPSVLTGPEHINLSTVRSMLVGLHVTRNHDLPLITTSGTGSTATGTATGQDLSSGNLSRPSPRNSTIVPSQSANVSQSSMDTNDSGNKHPFVIQNVKLAGAVPDFQIENERFSVHKYFATRILKRSLEYPSLPLAEIARNTWVPLETLLTSGDQMITHRALTKALMKHARKAYESDDDHERRAKEVANSIVEPLAGLLKYDDMGQIPIGEFEALTPKGSRKSTKTKPIPPRRLTSSVSSQTISLRLGIIFVEAKGVQRNPSIVVNDIVNNLKAQHNDSELITIDPEFNLPTASVADTKPLLLLPDFGGSAELQALYQARPNTILAIIDSTGRSVSELRNIRADLQKFGNRKIGAVTFCMTEKNLDQSMRANEGKVNYFPQKVLQTLTVMHGQPLFTADVLSDTSGVSNPLIIGAHISHPGPGCAEHCPSVAAVVASIDERLTNFPGSVRLQPTYSSAEWRGKHLKRTMEAQILDLDVMVTERLQACKKYHADAVPSVIFYRDSIGHLEKTTIDKEKDTISKALTAVFSTRVSFTYVVANKCRNSPYDPRMEPSMADDEKEIFTTSELKASNKGRQFRYFVQPATGTLPSLDLSMADLARLTYNLNTTFQLDKRVAIALPLYYARKLALHTFNYFRFAVTNRLDLVPSMLRRLHRGDKEVEENGKEMVKVMREYLFSDNPSGNNEVSQPFGRDNPWLEQLDEKMFYI